MTISMLLVVDIAEEVPLVLAGVVVCLSLGLMGWVTGVVLVDVDDLEA